MLHLHFYVDIRSKISGFFGNKNYFNLRGTHFLQIAILILLLSSFQSGSAQTSTTASGNWNTAGNWSTGSVPGSGTNVDVNHSMTLNTNISISKGDYYIYAPVTDVTGGTAYTLSVAGTGGDQGNFDVRANTVFEGAATINGNGTLTVRSGYTLTLGPTTFANNCIVVVESGATLIINGNLINNNNSTGITINGSIQINGNFTGGNGSAVSGTGTFETTGTITNNGSSTVFGSNNSCTSGPCSGNNLCVSNTIGTSQTICSGQTPAGLTGSLHGGYTYQWQSSTTSATTGFANIGSATSQNYSPGVLTSTTWYRRVVSSGGCTATSTAVQITVNANLTASVSIAASATSICSGTNVTFTATQTNGGTAPSYQWQLNGGNVGTNSATYSNSALANGDAVTCVMTSNYSCISGSPATSNSVSMTVNSSGDWVGATSTDWNTASNWCGGVPTSATDVVINSGASNMPLISGSASCKSLTVNSGATLTISGAGSLSAAGDISNSGTFSNNGTITLSGSSLQTITGVSSIRHLTLNNAAGASLSSSVTMLGVLTLTSGQLATNGNLILDLTTGAISGTGSGTLSGNITVKKTVTSSKYHYIASPLAGTSLADLNDDIQIKAGSYANFYFYDETVSDPNEEEGWTAISIIATALQRMKGYALYFNGATTVDFTNTYTHSSVPSNLTLTNTISSDATSDGWNLVGNPYPSTLDWEAASGWTKTGIGSAIYFWDPVNDRYASYVGGIGTNGGTKYIPSMQGFWVKVSTAGGTGTLGMNNNVRVTSTNPSLWKVASTTSNVKLTVSSDIYSDETVIRFRDDASAGFDDDLDADKLTNDGSTPSLYSQLQNQKYSINSLPDDEEELTIPVHLLIAFDGEYSLSAEDESMFGNYSEVLLQDLVADSIHDLKSEPEYTFQANTSDTTGRFLISFKTSGVTSSNHAQASSNIIIRSNESKLYIENTTNLNSADISVYSILGKPIKEIPSADLSSGSYSTDLSGETGIYIVKVKTREATYTGKVYLK